MNSIKKKSISLVLILILLLSGSAEASQRQITFYTTNETVSVFLGELSKRINSKEKVEITEYIKKWKNYYDYRLAFGNGTPSQVETEAMKKVNSKLNEYTAKYLLDGVSEWEEESFEYNNYVIENIKGIISVQDYEKLYNMCEKYETDMTLTDEQVQETVDIIITILKKYPQINEAEILNYLLRGSENILAIYDISSDEIQYENIRYVTLSENNSSVITEYPQIWNNIESIISQNKFENFDKLIISTDGKLNNLAYIIANDSMGSRWNISIDPADVVDENLFYETIIHEYFHYMTLNSTQVSYFKQPDIYVYSEGNMITEEKSYLNQFSQKFWGMLSQESVISDNKYFFYLRHKNDFVNEYAATSASEDICESFTFFVLRDKPSAETVAGRKLLFFYNYPELIEFRNQIRTNIANNKLKLQVAS